MNRPLVVLGATGSIGRQTLDVANRLHLDVAGLAAGHWSDDLARIAADWPDARVAVHVPSPDAKNLMTGPEAVAELAATPGAIVVNGIVGAAGLRPSVAALRAGNRLALANKESLVAAGGVVLEAASAGGGELVPVDSEHSALFQCLVGERVDQVGRLVLTASGGPFRGRTRHQLQTVTADEALAHPTWDMGRRVTIDSATLMNKGLEVIEAHFLFGMPFDRIDVVVHPQSIVHSLVEFVDGSVKAQLGEPDMRVPIQYAITHPERRPAPVPPLKLETLEFEAPDREAFPALDLAFAAGRAGGSAPAVLNAADEIAVDAFLAGKIPFLGIVEAVERTLDRFPHRVPHDVDDVIAIDGEARKLAFQVISASC